ncbi:NUDIX domain-containing protein [Chromobacterium alticapitis]|uniref:DNA mismatch repair protein MutT n=1 Tax=Chromobacterium alticapitis TaxID=2073169 RepID=A0A2S5DJI1_9NEIS|nr:NUDIX domain-containing protein [Chromobacterium alticapitis]POZ63189.1 DNA mismatch repair protein MutT [Chromobacterium alticapitis]
MSANKACLLLLQDGKLLWFRHPLAGCQLVKGTIEPGEGGAQAALRELREEAGIGHARAARDLGEWQSAYQDQVWSFTLCEVAAPLPEVWTHFCADDGGLSLDFFWHPLTAAAPTDSHPLYHRALAEARRRLADVSPPSMPGVRGRR